MVFEPGEHKSDSKSASTVLKWEGVRFAPDLNLNTGREGWYVPASICWALSSRRVHTGQQLYPRKGNKSTYSPSFSPDFGCFSLISKDSEPGVSVNITSSHNRSDDGEKSCSSLAKISPSLVDAKNAVVAALQITCLDRGSHCDLAILCPSTLRRGKVTTRLVDDTVFFMRKWLKAPLRIIVITLSLSKWSQGSPLM